MKQKRISAMVILAALLLAPLATVEAKKSEAYKGQAGMTFVNGEALPAHGLVVTLSNKGEVRTNPDNGAAGPFRNVSGNDSDKIEMTNPTEPIAGGGEGKVDLIFRSKQKKLAVTGWWWVDEKGKRIGKKQKP